MCLCFCQIIVSSSRSLFKCPPGFLQESSLCIIQLHLADNNETRLSPCGSGTQLFGGIRKNTTKVYCYLLYAVFLLTVLCWNEDISTRFCSRRILILFVVMMKSNRISHTTMTVLPGKEATFSHTLLNVPGKYFYTIIVFPNIVSGLYNRSITCTCIWSFRVLIHGIVRLENLSSSTINFYGEFPPVANF